MSIDGGKSVSWPWLFLLGGWSSLTITFLGKFRYKAHHLYIQIYQEMSYSAYPILGAETTTVKKRFWHSHSIFLSVFISVSNSRGDCKAVIHSTLDIL